MYDENYDKMVDNWKKIISYGPKPLGSKALKECSGYLLEEMQKITKVAYQDCYEITAWEVDKWELEVVEPNQRIIKSYLFLGSGASESFEGRVKFAGHNRIWNMYIWDRYMVVNIKGGILAYISVRKGGDAVPQMLFTGDSEIPHFIVGDEEAEFFQKASDSNTVIKGYALTRKIPNSKCINVVGTMEKKKKKVVICAHYDTVYATAGAYDNAAGSAVLLEIGRRLKDYEKNAEIELLLTDGEEYDLVGSRKRSKTCEGEDIAMVLNIDGVGREKVLEVWCGPEPFERKVRSYMEESGGDFEVLYKCPPPPGSDHAPYYDKGIPVCMLTFNDQGILHSPKDVYTESMLDNMGIMVGLSLNLLEFLNVIKK